jgi:hypothetical protein
MGPYLAAQILAGRQELRLAYFSKRTQTASTIVYRRWYRTLRKQFVHFHGRPAGFFAQALIEMNIVTPFVLTIKQESMSDSETKHFFKANRLGTELDGIAVVFLYFTVFVLDGDRRPVSLSPGKRDSSVAGHAMKLHHIGLSGQSQTERADT